MNPKFYDGVYEYLCSIGIEHFEISENFTKSLELQAQI